MLKLNEQMQYYPNKGELLCLKTVKMVHRPVPDGNKKKRYNFNYHLVLVDEIMAIILVHLLSSIQIHVACNHSHNRPNQIRKQLNYSED